MQLTQQTFALMKTSWRLLEDVFLLRPQKTSWSRRLYSSYSHVFRRRLRDVFKTSCQGVFKTFSRRLQDVFKMCCKNIFKTTSRRLQDVLKTSSSYFQNVFRFEEVSPSCTVLTNKSSKRIQHVPQMYCKDGYPQKDLLRSHFWEIYGQCTKFAKIIKISQVLVFHFTTPFSGFLQRRI